MILVPSHRRLLNGNKFLAVIILSSFLLACSKKTAPVATLPKKPVETTDKKEESRIEKSDVKEQRSIALLLPFYLNSINPQTADLKSINKAGLAIDYYQGFKFALDSLSSDGYNFKLNVWDSREQEVQIVNLARAKSVQENDLIVGPVFPESILTFNEFYKPENKLQISPLAASTPDQYNNPGLVTVNNTIDEHGWKVADFINKNYKPSKVNLLLINTKKTDDEKFASPIKKYIKSISENGFVIHELPNSIGLETALSKTLTNIVIVTSDDKAFVLPTIDRLYKSSRQGLKIELFGHPNWIKAQFLNVEKMQGLNTKITASYFIDYKSEDVKNFTSRYRQEFGLEPSEFAVKGFDTGYFFGKLLGKYGTDYLNHISTEQYQGLHNKFHFKKDEKFGYTNTEVMMLKYSGFELQVIK
ncbi:ABC transporter substrate-binding protein [Daejeonella oryzae]|uniref:ABC transporter substrate-binding protein n=1 Tax=Daejeonella oryzae TaxID=1122943 RepID=UPI0004023AA9|nr:ABC transporter substrate-binding protein [Daejeonella oryzae]